MINAKEELLEVIKDLKDLEILGANLVFMNTKIVLSQSHNRKDLDELYSLLDVIYDNESCVWDGKMQLKGKILLTDDNWLVRDSGCFLEYWEFVSKNKM